ncbi:hypothetical protein [Paenibacillus polymyxa]|uniref:hypothetical protein n=1 Tax=Paenibacillus polymyxa TaxID=1406 RepID=UPI00287FCA01|nr:hypothetical protein [Paenibacillus polymyxa]
MYDQSTINDEQRWTINNAHDPAIIKTDQGVNHSVWKMEGGQPAILLKVTGVLMASVL